MDTADTVYMPPAIQEALEASNNADMYPDSASRYGLWDVPKAYYHLYGDNTNNS